MNTSNSSRHKSVNSALGSLRAEGLKPNKKTTELLKKYTDGKITATKLHQQAVKLAQSYVK